MVTNFLFVNFVANKQDQAGALLLAWTIEILKNKIIPINKIVLIKINNGFLLCTGSLINFTFFLSTNFVNSPPLVTIKDSHPFSGK